MDGTIHSTQTVRLIQLDDFLGPRLTSLKLLKIDIEGYEDEVLKGATELLRRFKPFIYIELCSQYRASSDKAVKLLREHGYTFNRDVDLGSSVNGSTAKTLLLFHPIEWTKSVPRFACFPII
jgi:hypothetical protein